MNGKDIYLILNNIRSAYNVGAIFRTADAAGVKKIFLCGISPYPAENSQSEITDKIGKTALGAEKMVSWEKCKQTWRLMGKLKAEGVSLVAIEQTKNSKNIFKFKPIFPLALVLGNEVRGLSKKILSYADKVVEIPMLGKKESLNVSVAAGIALYQLKFGK